MPTGTDTTPTAAELTRHFVATVYVVNDGATALHEHDRLAMWLPPGGHVDRDELPHEAATREVREELGLSVDLLAPTGDLDSRTATALPRAQHFLLEDIDVREDGSVAHQHLDFVYYGAVPSRDIEPAPGEQGPEAWSWFTRAELAEAPALAADVREAGRRAIEAVESAATSGHSSN